MKRFEAFCDAVAHVNNYYEPESRSYELRNPGLLAGDAGNRIFSCHRAGYAAFLDRVQKNSSENPDANLGWLLEHFGVKMKIQKENAIDFMSRCADSAALSLETPLRWLMEENGNTSSNSSSSTSR